MFIFKNLLHQFCNLFIFVSLRLSFNLQALIITFYKSEAIPNDRFIKFYSTSSTFISLVSPFTFKLSLLLYSIDTFVNSGNCWAHFLITFFRLQTWQLPYKLNFEWNNWTAIYVFNRAKIIMWFDSIVAKFDNYDVIFIT